MNAKCTNCGAILPPLNPGTVLVRCRYCQLDQQIDRPPPMPPPPAPYAPSVPRAQRATSAVPLVAGVMALALVAASAMVFRMSSGPSASSSGGGFSLPGTGTGGGMNESQLATITLAATPEKIAAITGVAADSSFRMRVPLSNSRFDAVTFVWNNEHTSHVSEFYFNLTGAKPEDEAIRQRMHTLLGRRYLKGESFQWQDSHVYFSPSGGVLSVGVQIEWAHQQNANWEHQIDALWDVARAAIGLSVKPDDSALRDWLGRGYTFASLAKLDPQTDIDASHDALAKLFPGVVTKTMIGLDHTIAIDHPWFGEASFTWKNKKGAKLATVMIRPPPGTNDFANQADIDACVANAFGKPSRRGEPDHLRGDYDTIWEPAGGGEIRVYKHMVKLELSEYPFTRPMPTATWQKAMSTLDACGKR
jgi:hypothetical protein